MNIKLYAYCKLLISEGMSLYIKNTNYTKYDTLWNLSVHLQRLAYDVLEKLPSDQKAYFSKNHPTELLTIDGLDDMDSKSGTLNLYYSGYTMKTLKDILKVVLTELKKLNIPHGKLKMEQSKMYKYKVIRIPILNINQEYTGAPELHMSNRNAYHIFKNILQFEPNDESGSSFSFNAHDLKQRVEAILKHDPDWIEKHQINKIDSSWPEAERDEPQNFENPHDDVINNIFGSDGAKVISMGLNSDDIKNRLYKIWDIADWAINHNKTELYTV
jgi:hypothetical protein